MKIYISGKITGCDNYFDKFEDASIKLKQMGLDVVNPALTNGTLPKNTTYEQYMKISLCMLDMCDAIYMIDGWENSCGANRELGYAIAKDIKIIYEKDITCEIIYEKDGE